MKFSDYVFSARCKNCNALLINQKVYTVREPIPTGLTSAFGSNEPMLYDAVNCPKCGRQRVLGARLRNNECH